MANFICIYVRLCKYFNISAILLRVRNHFHRTGLNSSCSRDLRILIRKDFNDTFVENRSEISLSEFVNKTAFLFTVCLQRTQVYETSSMSKHNSFFYNSRVFPVTFCPVNQHVSLQYFIRLDRLILRGRPSLTITSLVTSHGKLWFPASLTSLASCRVTAICLL